MRYAFRYLYPVEMAIERKKSATCSLRKLDTDLLKGCHHPIGSQIRIACQFFDLVDLTQSHFPCRVMRSTGLIIKSCISLSGEAMKNIIDRVASGLHVGCNR